VAEGKRPALDYRRIVFYLAFTFGIAWATALVVYLTGGLAGSRALIPVTPVTVALVLVPTLYMFSPALSHALTRLVTREGWGGLYLKPRLGEGWRSWVAAWLGCMLLVLAGAAVYFVAFPETFDPSLDTFREQLSEAARRSGEPLPLGPGVLFAIQAASPVLVAPIFNSIFTFGEEFGWRAYLQPRLLPLGGRRAMMLMGLIWGIWHWPLIAMGHNYGQDYPGHPWLGMLTMTWFTFVTGTFLGWLALRGGSVWPAVLGHATINATAGLGLLVSTGDANLLLGPLPVGLLGSAGFSAAAMWILLRWRQRGSYGARKG
jgi:membrane protease YdiL (CAAX protease family)